MLRSAAQLLVPVLTHTDAVVAAFAHPEWSHIRMADPARYGRTVTAAGNGDDGAIYDLLHGPDSHPCTGDRHHMWDVLDIPPRDREAGKLCRDCTSMAAAPDLLAEVDALLDEAEAAGVLAGRGDDMAIARAVGADPELHAATAAGAEIEAGTVTV